MPRGVRSFPQHNFPNTISPVTTSPTTISPAANFPNTNFPSHKFPQQQLPQPLISPTLTSPVTNFSNRLYSYLLGTTRTYLTVYKLPTLSTLIQLIFSHSKICDFFYFKITHLFIRVMLQTEIVDILLHGEIGVG